MLSESRVKGEHWCKTIIKGVQDWGETEMSASAVFGKNTSLKRNKAFKIKNLHFLTFLLVVGMYFTRSWDEHFRSKDVLFRSKDVLSRS